jgi:hypothetical protein
MLALASFLAMANHVSLDYSATEQQLVITVRKKK